MKEKTIDKIEISRALIGCLFMAALLLFNLPHVSADILGGTIKQPGLVPINDGKVYPAISIKDWCIPFTGVCFGGVISESNLLENSPTCSNDCLAIGHTTLNQDLALIDSVKFQTVNYDENGDEIDRIDQPIRSYQLYYATNQIENDLPDYEYQCENDPTNVTTINYPNQSISIVEGQICSNVQTGTHTDYSYDWQPYSEGQILPSGDYYWKLEGSKKPDRNVDWIITSQGQELTDWAIWGSTTLANDNVMYLNLNQTTGKLTDIHGLYNYTGTGTGYFQGINGKIENGVFLSSQGAYTYSRLNGNMPISTDWTLAGWFNLTYTTTGSPMLFGHSAINYIQYWPDETTLQWFAGGTNMITNIGSKLNQWYYIALMRNSTGAYLYVNSTLKNYSIGANPSFSGLTNIGSYIDNQTNGWIGDIDEVGYWNRSLTNTELNTLYNNGVGLTYPFGYGSSMTLNSPSDNKVSNNPIIFNCSANVVSATLTNISLFTNQTGNWVLLNSSLLTGTSNTTTFSQSFTPDKTLSWTCQGCASDLSCGYGTNRTLNIDTINPSVIVYYPTGTINGLSNGTSLGLNYSISDLNLNSCQYEYNNQNYTIANCLQNTTFNYVSGLNSLRLWANDSAGNYAFNDTNWTAGFSINNVSYNNVTLSGSYQTFNININSTSYPALPYIVYNGTSYIGSITPLGSNNYLLINSLNVPQVTTQTNYTFFWEINTGSYYSNSSNYQQTVNPLQIDDCSVYNNILFNFTQIDEDSELPFNGTILNSSIKLNVQLYDPISGNLLGIANMSYTANSNPKFCVGNNLINSSLNIKGLVEYQANTYVHKFFYLNNYTVTNKIFNMNLPDLLSSRSQEFLVTYKDSNFLPESNVYVYVNRYYTAENQYKTVEVAKTDNDGHALIHLVLGDVIYNLVFTDSNGNILSVLTNYVPFCTNVAIGDCTINTNAFQSNINPNNFYQINGVSYNENCNVTNRSVTDTFVSLNVHTINQTVKVFDALGNNTICSNILTSPSGTLICNIPSTYGNTQTLIDVYDNNALVYESQCGLPQNASSIYGLEGIFWAVLIIITLSMLFMTSMTGIVIGSVIGIIISGMLSLINIGNIFGKLSIVIWIILAGGIIIWKLNSNGVESR